ncbi:hypothetical protein [Streptomyces cinnamoneus]|uniref:Baseplate assembly protein n=1 Tax=Streptomyces cinnamoneus TaxID=53446 RepID=A0A918WGG3_STRCJ|nr:hypothetical protein [Streptomyces cinnamoneus]GHC44367.1 hypothetical protein GCM10010507_19200 [Streptomyces cinnamoneus]
MRHLSVPDLDDLRFQPLVDAAKRALPRRAPGWTDHNVSDPGVTLLEACAQRVDALLYRTARMTPRVRDRLLALTGLAPVPATPCRVRVVLTRAASGGGVEVREGTRLIARGTPDVVVRTAAAVTVPASGSVTVEAVEEPQRVDERIGVSDHTPGQRFRPSRRPWHPLAPAAAPPASPLRTVTVGGRPWAPVHNFTEATGSTTECYWWDAAAGEVVFGPAVPFAAGQEQLGAVPPAGAEIRAVYEAHRGTVGDLPAGTPLRPADAGRHDLLRAAVDRTLAAGQDAEDWRQVLDRAALGLALLCRAVTVADYERLLLEHADLVVRGRITTAARPEDTRVPGGLSVPDRPARVSASAVAVRAPEVVVHYRPGADGRITHVRLPLEGGHGPDVMTPREDEGDSPPEFARSRLDAVLWLDEDRPRLWFSGDRCAWSRTGPKPLKDVFPGLPAEFHAGVDAAAALPVGMGMGAGDTYEVFLFRGDALFHRRFTYRNDGSFEPAGDRGMRSLIAESFPALSPRLHRSLDAVVVLDEVFYCLKDDRTEPALWRREDAALRALVMPRLPDDGEPVPEDALKVPRPVLHQARAVLDGARLLGERLSLGPPDYRAFTARATVRPWAGTSREDTRRAARRALVRYFHPGRGGPDGDGWPWGRPVLPGDVFAALETVPEVRAVDTVAVIDADGFEQTAVPVPESGLPWLREARITVTTG